MDKIKDFLKLKDGDGDGDGYDYGDGNGNGSGHANDNGNGSGSGYGSGYANGSGSGYGDGYGSGYGIKMFNGSTVYQIDNVPTLIDRVVGNLARGSIIMRDMTLKPCFIVKNDRYFAHGETVDKARESLLSKMFDNLDEEERLEMFNKEFDRSVKYPAMKFFEWHNRLTGSCEMGRHTFAKNHGIDLDTDEFTVEEFVNLTKDDFGGEIIIKLMG